MFGWCYQPVASGRGDPEHGPARGTDHFNYFSFLCERSDLLALGKHPISVGMPIGAWAVKQVRHASRRAQPGHGQSERILPVKSVSGIPGPPTIGLEHTTQIMEHDTQYEFFGVGRHGEKVALGRIDLRGSNPYADARQPTPNTSFLGLEGRGVMWALGRIEAWVQLRPPTPTPAPSTTPQHELLGVAGPGAADSLGRNSKNASGASFAVLRGSTRGSQFSSERAKPMSTVYFPE